jgi:thiol-disulfide isomerase/thioredoxin
MKKLIVFVIGIVFTVTACKKDVNQPVPEMTLGDFTIAAEYLTPGQSVDISYNGTSEDVESLYYFMVNDKSYPMDINLSDTKQGSIRIPDSAQAVAFNFKIDGKYDDNDKKGYLVPLKNAEGNILPGSQSALATYAMYYGSDFGVDMDNETVLKDIEQDINTHPELKEEWYTMYLNLLYRQDQTKGETLINEHIASLKAIENKSEDDYSALIRLSNTLGNKEDAEGLINEVKTKFPNGKTAKNSYGDAFYEATDLAQKEDVFKDFSSKYKSLGNVGEYMARSLAMMHYENGDTDAFNSYINRITSPSAKADVLNSVAWPLAEKGEQLDFAANLSKESLNLTKIEQTNLEDKPDYFTESQYQTSLENTYAMYADTYALILFKQGRLKDAIAYQAEAVGNGTNGEINERYIEFLMADKQYDLVAEKAENFIKDGHGSPKIKEFYKDVFMKTSDDTEAFETKLAALEQTAYDNYVEELKKTMIDEDAPEFALKNTSGETVSLESLRGKTIILDFWATWCGPCKASFPGMQEVVTKYKDDDTVVLLFVDTFEDGEDRETLVTDFIAKNKYDFHVVYDTKLENSQEFKVADQYGVTGIPTKVVIDKNGKMRFKAVGYSGQTEKLVKEMDIMIDILKS